jgi:hypothetical protein
VPALFECEVVRQVEPDQLPFGIKAILPVPAPKFLRPRVAFRHLARGPRKLLYGACAASKARRQGRTEPWPDGKQRAALDLLAACPDGCTEAAMKANGFAIGLLATLVRARPAAATPGVVQAGGRTLGVVRIAITEMGRATVGA